MKLGKREALRELFESRPGQWISAEILQQVGGKCAWRTRVSDLRRRNRMDIDNRLTYIVSGDERVTVSHYRYLPASAVPKLDDLHMGALPVAWVEAAVTL